MSRDEILAGREKCDCVWTGSGNIPRNYMKLGLCGGQRYWCEKCPNILEDAIYINNSKCRIDECKKQAFYSIDGTRNDRVCGYHRIKEKIKDYINVVDLRCLCGNRPSFNYPGKIHGVACKKCKTEGMEDVINPRCLCGKQMSFNFPGETRGIACKECAKDGMVDVKHNKCLCGTRASFNYPGETVGITCSKCAKDGMENIVSPRCPCGTRPSFNFIGESHGVACQDCKLEGMKNVVDPKCICGKQMVFNYPSETRGVACIKCKNNDMIDVVNKVCPGYGGVVCPVRTQLHSEYSYCSSCDPDPKRAQSRKKFEDAFFQFADGKINLKKREFRIDFDRTETKKKFARIDGIVFKDEVIVCIEVDENGHADDSYDCDESRMHLVTGELLQQYPGCDIAWVRVNPTIPGLANQWAKKAKASREKLFEQTIIAVNEAKHGVIYID